MDVEVVILPINFASTPIAFASKCLSADIEMFKCQ